MYVIAMTYDFYHDHYNHSWWEFIKAKKKGTCIGKMRSIELKSARSKLSSGFTSFSLPYA